MSWRRSRNGASLLELLVAMLSAAVLVAVLGAIVLYSFQAWQRNLVMRDMQDDAWLTSQTLSMAIREAQNGTIAMQGADRLTLGRRYCYRANSQLQYSATGPILAFDPDTNVANNTMALCRNYVTACTFTRGSNLLTTMITINIVLSNASDRIVITNSVFNRNY